MSDWHCKEKGWRMSCVPADEHKEQYFVIDPFTKDICAITDDPDGFSWSKPHVLTPTRGLHFKNAQMVSDGKNIWVDPIDKLKVDHVLPDVCNCIIGKPPHKPHISVETKRKTNFLATKLKVPFPYGILAYYVCLAAFIAFGIYFFRLAVK